MLKVSTTTWYLDKNLALEPHYIIHVKCCRISVCRSGQVRLRPDLRNWNLWF